jgi:hypothetical protein
MDWYDLLAPDLRAAAYKANNELAWARHDALRVVSILERHSYDVIGVDVWLPTEPGPTIPTPYVYDWAKSDASSDRVAKSAAGFIASFEWDPNDAAYYSAEPFFNILAVQRNPSP